MTVERPRCAMGCVPCQLVQQRAVVVSSLPAGHVAVLARARLVGTCGGPPAPLFKRVHLREPRVLPRPAALMATGAEMAGLEQRVHHGPHVCEGRVRTRAEHLMDPSRPFRRRRIRPNDVQRTVNAASSHVAHVRDLVTEVAVIGRQRTVLGEGGVVVRSMTRSMTASAVVHDLACRLERDLRLDETHVPVVVGQRMAAADPLLVVPLVARPAGHRIVLVVAGIRTLPHVALIVCDVHPCEANGLANGRGRTRIQQPQRVQCERRVRIPKAEEPHAENRTDREVARIRRERRQRRVRR